MVNFTVSVVDTEGQPIADARVGGTFSQQPGIPIETIRLTVEADGYEPYIDQPYTNPSRIGITLTKKPVVSLPDLRVEGQCFKAGDAAFTAIESSDFALLARWQNGEDISDTLSQRQAVGFNMLRVWTAFDIPGIGVFTTIDYAHVPAFVALCASYGLYVEFTAYTGWNDPAHWANLIGAAQASRPHPLLELVNELDQNTNEPDALGRIFRIEDYAQAPAPLLSSHGSNGSEHLAVRPAWSYETFHTNDASEWQRKNGHNAMELADGTEDWPGSHLPVLTNESTRCPDRDDDPMHYYDAAASAALLCAGSCFHSVSGKSGRPWTDDELACAISHAAGARSVDLAFQAGRYNRLEPGENLRVYQRILPDGRAWTVDIRG